VGPEQIGCPGVGIQSRVDADGVPTRAGSTWSACNTHVTQNRGSVTVSEASCRTIKVLDRVRGSVAIAQSGVAQVQSLQAPHERWASYTGACHMTWEGGGGRSAKLSKPPVCIDGGRQWTRKRQAQWRTSQQRAPWMRVKKRRRNASMLVQQAGTGPCYTHPQSATQYHHGPGQHSLNKLNAPIRSA
jgi:hypothetical protein